VIFSFLLPPQPPSQPSEACTVSSSEPSSFVEPWTKKEADQEVARKAAALERTKKLREKERQQAEFIAKCTL
jgi:hypothetical protein